MITREEVIAEIAKVPEKHLPELYEIVKNLEDKQSVKDDESVMAKLRRIKISATPDFSMKANLYRAEEEDAG